MITRIVILGFVLGNLALAQDGGAIPADISAWFASTASLAAVVAALVALLRKHILRGLDGLAVVGASLLLGVGLAFAGRQLGYLGPDWLIFGLSAGLIASGGVDLVRGLANNGNNGTNDQSSSTDADADRVRLR